jgi:hypothetical protein
MAEKEEILSDERMEIQICEVRKKQQLRSDYDDHFREQGCSLWRTILHSPYTPLSEGGHKTIVCEDPPKGPFRWPSIDRVAPYQASKNNREGGHEDEQEHRAYRNPRSPIGVDQRDTLVDRRQRPFLRQ